MTRIEDVLAKDRSSSLPQPPSIEKTIDTVMRRLEERRTAQTGTDCTAATFGVLPVSTFGAIPWTVA